MYLSPVYDVLEVSTLRWALSLWHIMSSKLCGNTNQRIERPIQQKLYIFEEKILKKIPENVKFSHAPG